jgi:hypothetical protein
MRTSLVGTVLLSLIVPACAHAAGYASHAKVTDAINDPALLAEFEDEAQHADPREQCFRYTQLVQVLTEIAGKAMVEGDVDKTYAVLAKVEHYTELIHLALTKNTHKLRQTEELMEQTTYRFSEYLHAASVDDTSSMRATLKKLDKVHNEVLTEVFQH